MLVMLVQKIIIMPNDSKGKLHAWYSKNHKWVFDAQKSRIMHYAKCDRKGMVARSVLQMHYGLFYAEKEMLPMMQNDKENKLICTLCVSNGCSFIEFWFYCGSVIPLFQRMIHEIRLKKRFSQRARPTIFVFLEIKCT